MLNSEFVSRISGTLNSLSKDSRISKRYMLHVGRRKSEFYIAQKLNSRTLRNEDNIYSTISCVEMEKIDVVRCDILEFRRCKSLMRSKEKLPKLIYSQYGSSLKEVTSTDNEKEFKSTTPSQYRRNNSRIENSDYIEYYVKDRYLYIVDCEIELVNVYLITTETDKIETASTCSEKNNCKSLWDYDFIVPSKLEEVVVAETLKEISTKLQIPTDELPNLNQNEK